MTRQDWKAIFVEKTIEFNEDKKDISMIAQTFTKN